MSNDPVILGLDAGTHGVRTLAFDNAGAVVHQSGQDLHILTPQPGWAEMDAVEVADAALLTLRRVLTACHEQGRRVAGLGITNMRETTVLWDRATGRPLHNAVLWMSRQSEPYATKWARAGLTEDVRARTGVGLEPRFSASKIAWLLDHVPGARERAARGELAVGTIDSWLLWTLTEGRAHATDYSNASTTLLFNITSRQWDETLLDAFGLPAAVLPQALPSSSDFGVTSGRLTDAEVPILAVLGDQQAGLFGQGCFTVGTAKNTYGTAGVLTVNCGSSPVLRPGLTTSVAWGLDKDQVSYETESLVFHSGHTLQWLRDSARMVHDAPDTEWFASKVPDAGGVYLVPAFTGLGAPYWDPSARAAILGIGLTTSHDHIVRAALESLAYQVRDGVETLESDGGTVLDHLRVDGGAARNNLLCQFQADLLGKTVIRPTVTEMTALGVASLAGLRAGVWRDLGDLAGTWHQDRTFEPAMTSDRRDELYAGWRRACALTRGWTSP